MNVTITSMREWVNMPEPGKVVPMVRVEFRSDTGYTGYLEIPKADIDKVDVQKMALAAVPKAAKLIGKTAKA